MLAHCCGSTCANTDDGHIRETAPSSSTFRSPSTTPHSPPQADRRALMEGRRPSRTSWLLARIQEAGTTGVEFQTLCQLAEAHVPGLYRSRSQIRSQLQLLRSQGKVRMPGGKYMCKSLYLMEKEKRRKEYEARVQSR